MKKQMLWYHRQQKDIKLVLFVVALILGLGLFYWQAMAAKTDQPGLWGMADAKESNINPKVSGRVVALYVDEGDTVKKGQVIARLDKDTGEAAERQARASLAAQYALVQQTVHNSDSQSGKLDAALKQAEATCRQTKAALDLANKDENRYRTLLAEDAVPQQTYDTYASKQKEAQDAYEAAAAGVESAKAALEENEANASAQQAALEQANALQGALDSASINVNETEIRAPYDGVITQRFVEEGALVSPSVPLFAIQDASDNWVDFKVAETDIGKYRIGDDVTMEARDGKTKLTGTIESIRRKSDFATQKATSERGDTDVMAFNVKVRTNDDSVWPGMRFRLLSGTDGR